MDDDREQNQGEEEPTVRFRFAGPGEGRGGDIDANLLAAWLDGRASPDEAESVERALLADPDLLDAVRDARAVSSESLPTPPEGLLERIDAALERATAPKRAAASHGAASAISRWKVAAAAGLVLVAGLFGFWLGRTRGVTPAPEEAALSAQIAAELDVERYEFIEVAWVPGE